MAARHKRARGGKVYYAGGASNVAKEAEERKRGGPCGMKMGGKAAKMNLGRPGRKRGGRVGADMSPMSSAAKYTKMAGETSDYSE